MRYTTFLSAALAAGLLLSGAGSALAQSWIATGALAPSAEGLSPAQDDREVHALNWLSARGYRNFGTVTPVGPNFQIVATMNGAPVTVIVNPETGEITGG